MSDDNAVSTEAEEREPGSTHTSAHELGDITAQRLQGGLRKLAQTVGTEGDGVDYYRFTLSEAREVRLGLKLRQGEAELYLEDAEGNVLARSMAHAGYEAAVRTLLPGTYYVRVEAVGAAASEYEFRYGVLEANASFRPASDSPWHTGLAERMGMPSFGEAGYGFELSETVDGRVSGVLLGTVLAVDPNGESLSYGIVGGNGSGLFALGGASGELSYVGAGEDFEGGAGPYELTVRASDGTHTIDTTVTVTVTDAAEQPAFGDESYAFELAENADGRANGLSLGRVLATDPDGDEVRYSLTGGNESMLFNIDAASGELYYVGPGEDYESGVTSYEVTVRASDAAHTVDTTVTVTVTDEGEAPAFGEESYAFELAENVDGRVNRLSLGAVTATDPDSDTVRYSLLDGNDSSLFAIEETSGELFYVGAGEDFEGGVTSYEVTVRASDAAHTVDTTVMVTVTDAAEAPAFGEESYAFELAENVDGRVNGLSLGSVTATDPDSDAVRYSLVGGNDSSLFAIEETSGELFYVGAGEDFEGGVTSYELTVRASDAAHTVDTTVTVTVTDEGEAPAFGKESYAFELAENVDGRVNGLSLGSVTATDPDSDTVRYSLLGGNDSSLFAIEETSGELFYVGAGEDFEGGVTSYELTVRASDAAHTVDTTVTVTVTDAAEAPAFGEESYAFELAENVDGRVNRISLGTVTATDPDSDTVRYSLVGGNDSSLFAIEETSGELFYVGAGEDFEGGVTSYELTVRASDGTHTIDTTVTVTVTDAAEAPAFGEESYAFELAENADGRANGLSLGRVLATDPDGDEVRYSLTGGNELFTVDETSGELYYVGPGEDYESGVTSYELTVRASDAAHTVDTTVTVTVTDEAEAPAFGEESYAFELAENVDGRVNRLSLGTVTATDPDSDTVRYSLLGGNDSSLFAIEETSGELFYVGAGEDFEGGVTSYELTVRASDGTHTIDTTVTVTVTDAAEQPAFGEESYAFELAENADGRANGLSLGRVLATDPDGDEVRYSLAGGNELFTVDETSGELYYVGPGEDYESGVTSYEVTVRASDAAHTVDTTVTVTVTDAAEAPAFGEESYAFALAENVDGSVNRISLGLVAATDPDGDSVRYSLSGGNDSSLFVIGAASGELYYVGGGEDFEGGVTSYELTVRASDGTDSTEATVTVTVTDEAEAPAFGKESYAFELAENVDGRVNRLSLGTVTATDPDSDTVRYSLLGGNDSSLFAIEETSGELFYVGAGEDFEGGVTSYELTIRASDGTHTIDTTVTVTVTDVAEQPAFGEESYAFELAENADGRANGLSLGRVLATDPDGDEVRYSLTGGNESRLFNIDETSGELYYVGPGEDYESGVTSYEVTVRASDAAHTVDTTVMVTVTDAAEAPAFGEESYAFELAENVDGRVNRLSLGAVTATDPDGDAVRYSLLGGNDSSLFAIEETSGELYYVGAGEDFEGGVTSYELTIRASDGTHTIDTTVTVTVTDAAEQPAFGDESYAFELAENADGRANGLSLGRVLATDPDGDEVRYSLTGGNESMLFNIDETSGELYYVGPGEDYESGVTSYELTVRASDAAHTVDTTVTVTVTDAAEAPAFGEESYAFELAENVDGRVNRLSLGTVTATDPDSDGVRYSLLGGNDSSLFAIEETSGELSYVGAGEDFEGGVTSYELTIRASDGTHTIDTTVTVTVTDAAEAPAFGDESYAFELAENADGRANGLSLGRVLATDPDGDEVRYSLAGGNELFTVDETSGELYYVGPGEDYESGVTSYELTVRASDAAHTVDTTVTVTVTDAAEAPAFGEESYAFELAENVDGRVNRLSLGAVTATDPDSDAVRYSLLGGNDSSLFVIGAASGELYYVGGGEDFEGGVTSYELTVRASDGTHTVDTTVTVTVADDPFDFERTTIEQGSSEPVGEDLPTGRETNGEVRVNAEPVDGTLHSQSDRDWFAVTLAPGRIYAFNVEGDTPRGGTGTVPAIRGLRDANGDPVAGIVGGAEVRFTTDAAAVEAVYYVEVGDGGDSGSGLSASRGFATRGVVDTLSSSIVDTRGSSDGASGYRLCARDITDTSIPPDYAANVRTVASVVVEGSATSWFESANDRDWFAVALEAGKTYRIDLEGRSTGAGTLYRAYINGVHDSHGTYIPLTTGGYGTGEGGNSRVYFTASADATYYIVASATERHNESYSRWKLSTYKLSITETSDDFLGSTGTTGTVSVGSSVMGTMEVLNDRDWFAVDLEKGKTYRIDLEGAHTGGGTLWDPYLHGIYDADGNHIAGTANDDGGVGFSSQIYFKPDADATYYVAAGYPVRPTSTKGYWAVRVSEGSLLTIYNPPGGTYTVRVDDVTDAIEDDLTADTSTTGTVSVGGFTTGYIDSSSDRDWFAVLLEAGKTYQIDLEGDRTGAGTLPDPRLYGVYDGDEHYLAGTANDDAGRGNFNSRAHFTPQIGSTYYVAVGANGDYPGTYKLSVFEFVGEVAADRSTTGILPVNLAVTGKINTYGDRDWFAVNLEAGETYRFDLEGRPTNAGKLTDPYIHGIYRADGTHIGGTANNDGGHGRNSRVWFTPTEEGIYYVSVGHYVITFVENLDTYRLSVTRFSDDFAAGTETSGTVDVGGTATGEIENSGDLDWFAVTLEAGKTYRIDLEGSQTGDGTLYDPYLRGVHDDNGVLLDDTTDDDGGTGRSSRVFFTADQDDTYYVAAGADGDFEGTYTLSVTEVPDDYPDDTSTTGSLTVGGSATGEIDYEGDRDWFAVTLEAGKTYRIDLEGSQTGDGTLYDPYLRGVHDDNGVLLDDTTDDDGGTGRSSRVFFTADQDDTYYVAAAAYRDWEGTYTLSMEEVTDSL